jgi:hypothetical protein
VCRELARESQVDGIASRDLTPMFRGHASAGEPLFFEGDGHATSRGCRLIAEALPDRLKTNAERPG